MSAAASPNPQQSQASRRGSTSAFQIQSGKVTISGPSMREIYSACSEVVMGRPEQSHTQAPAERAPSGIAAASVRTNEPKRGRPVSAQTRAKLAAAAKKRWRKQQPMAAGASQA